MAPVEHLESPGYERLLKSRDVAVGNEAIFRRSVDQLIAELPDLMSLTADTPFVVPSQLLHRSAELGLIGPGISEENGGLGLSTLQVSDGVVALSYDTPGAALTDFAVGHSLTAYAIEKAMLFAPDDTRRAELKSVLDDLRTGRARAFFGLTDLHHGSDVARHMDLKATRLPDGQISFKGPKNFITNPENADYGVVIADLDGEAIVFLLDMNSPQEQGAFIVKGYHDKTGFKGPVLTSIEFKDFIVDASAILGNWKDVARPTLITGRNVIAEISMGIAMKAMDIAYGWAKYRIQFDKFLVERPTMGIRLRLGFEQLTVCDALMKKAAKAWDDGDSNAGVYASMAKLTISESALAMTILARQLLGARGVVKEFIPKDGADNPFDGEPDEYVIIIQRLEDALTATIVEGANMLQADELIAPYVSPDQMAELANMLPMANSVWSPHTGVELPTVEARLEFIKNFVPDRENAGKKPRNDEEIANALEGAVTIYRRG